MARRRLRNPCRPNPSPRPSPSRPPRQGTVKGCADYGSLGDVMNIQIDPDININTRAGVYGRGWTGREAEGKA